MTNFQPSKQINGQKVNILVENKTTVSAIINFSKFCKTFTIHIKTSSMLWLWVLFLGSNNDKDLILVYCYSLPPHSTNSQWHLTVSCPEQKYFNSFVNTKNSTTYENNQMKFFENKNFRVFKNILWENCLSIRKFQFKLSGGLWHGMAHFL